MTYKGQPVADGNIVFFPTGNADGKPSGAAIANGRYRIAAEAGPPVGSVRVEIQSYRKTGRKIPDLMGDATRPDRPLIDEKINELPPQFHVDSRLAAEIKPGENTLDFSL